MSAPEQISLLNPLPNPLTGNERYPISQDNGGGYTTYYANPGTPRTAAEIAAGVTPTNYTRDNSPAYDMSRYGVWDNIANSGPAGTDVNSPIIQAVFNMVKVYGGTMVFPYGDYSFYLDISGATAPVFIEGNGSIFRCYSATPTESAVIFANNSGTSVAAAGTPNIPVSYGGAVVTFRDCAIVAQMYSGGVVTGDLNCAMAIYGTAVKCWNVAFEYGKIAAFFGCYCQYTEFWSSAFYLSSLNATSAGCILTGYGNGSGSNEVEFFRCVWQLNAVALQILGAIKTRVYGGNMQGNGTAYPYGIGAVAAGVLVLGPDLSGFAALNPTIEGVWFEVNYAPHIFESGECGSVIIHHCAFFGGGPYMCAITTTFTNDWVVNDNMVYSATMLNTFGWPSPDPGTAKLTFHGNNWVPTLALSHPGLTDLDLHIADTFTGTLTGVTTTTTGTITYSIDGSQWSMLLPAMTGTSNTTACTITGGPAILTPVTGGVLSPISALEDSGAIVAGGAASLAAGVITLYKGNLTTGFTNSGTKGINAACYIQGNLY